MRIVQGLFEYGVYDTLAYLRADLSQSLSQSMYILFSGNDDEEVGINPLLDSFRSNSIVLLFFRNLGSCSRISTGPI